MKEKLLSICFLTLIIFTVNAQEAETFTDSRDGQVYKTVKIGEQVWMAENMKYFIDDQSKCCLYEHKKKNLKKYGYLYRGSAVQSVCPDGWHVPDNQEWETLIEFSGGEDIAGSKLKSSQGWIKNGGDKNNLFQGIPAGWRLHDFHKYEGSHALWWSSTPHATNQKNAYCLFLTYQDNRATISPSQSSKNGYYSVRCIKDEN